MIYFVKNSDGLVKIGFTKNLQARIYSLRREHGPISVLKCIEGNIRREKELHQQFHGLRVRGEWFSLDEVLSNFIDQSEPAKLQTEFEEIEIEFGKNIKNLRILKNITREELARRAGVSMNAVRHLENGEGASTRVLFKILVILGKLDWIKNVAPVVSINPLNMVRGKPRQRVRKSCNR